MAGELTPSDFTHGYYEFKGQVGGEIVDLSDAGFNLLVTGAVDVLTGKFGNGLEFDGSNDKAVSAQARYADLTDQLGVFGWLHLLRTSTGVDGYLWKGDNPGTGQDFVLFGINDRRVHARVNNGAPTANTDDRGIADPFFFVLNYDGVNYTIHWADPSVNSNSEARTGNIRDTGDLWLGGTSGLEYSECRYSQLGIRNAPFTVDEMNFLYNSGAGRLLGTNIVILRRRMEGY